jgi:hypothetical protein
MTLMASSVGGFFCLDWLTAQSEQHACSSCGRVFVFGSASASGQVVGRHQRVRMLTTQHSLPNRKRREVRRLCFAVLALSFERESQVADHRQRVRVLGSPALAAEP